MSRIKGYNTGMKDLSINGVILRTKSKELGELGDITVMGKTLTEWAADALNAPYKPVDALSVINMCEKLRAAVDRNKTYTAILYCDAPLVPATAVRAAIDKLKAENSNMITLPRGVVMRTDYLFNVDALYLQEPVTKDAGEYTAVTDGESLSRITEIIRNRIVRYHASNGVRITDAKNTFIDCEVVIGKGVVIEPYNFIKGKTIIKDGATIMPGNYIENCIIGANTRIDSSRLYNSFVGAGTRVGPFAYLRPDSVIGENCRIGDFVEIKNSIIADGCKVSHLSYIGDAELGEDCNVGCGVVFANYDGKNKYRSIIGKRVFIGSNANIVAPVNVADYAFIAAGSTITKGVPSQALAIARARQTLIPEWKGNAYAPPEVYGKAAPEPVRFEDGIIDGSAALKKSDDDN